MRARRLISKPFMTALGLAVGLSLFLAKGVATAPQGAATAKPAAAATPPSPPATNEWLTWGYDQERTLWNRAEKAVGKDNVGQLTLKWKTQLPTAPRLMVLATLTAPLVATVNGAYRVFTVGSDDTVYAVDAETGKISWQRAFPNKLTPPVPGDYRCPNTQNATPVIDKESGTIYVSTSDGKLRSLSLVNGEDKVPALDFTQPFSRNWSLNLIDGVMYSPTARGCMGIPSHFTSLDLKTHRKQEVFTGTGVPGGAWGRGGLVRGPLGIYTQTADGPYDPAAGKFANSVLALSFKDLRIMDSYTPENWEYINDKDLDLASTNPVVFPFQKWTLLASVAKESVISLLDASNLGGASHQTPLYTSPRWGNDEALLHDRGVWGAMATWEDGGRRFLSMSMLGPVGKNAPPFKYTNGPAADGSIMTFEVVLDPATSKPSLVPIWISRELHAPDLPVVANGVVYAYQSGKDSTETRSAGGQSGPRTSFEGAPEPYLPKPAGPGPGAGAGRGAGAAPKPVPPSRATNAILYAFDAATGKELFRSELDSFNHFAGNPVVAGGQVYTVTWDGKLHAFGLKK